MINNINNQPLVSILIPLYNQERYFEKCIRSVCDQTYKNLEIIVVNDGSTDKSSEILSKWASKDNRIKVVNKQNEGLPMARKDGYLNATGEYICFVDSDDQLVSNGVEVMVKHIMRHQVDMVICTAKRMLGILKWSRITGPFPKDHVVRQPELFNQYYVNFFGKASFPNNMWARLIKKTAIDKAYQQTDIFMTELRFMGEDLYFNMKIFPHLQSMVMTDDIVYYYRYGGTVDHFNKYYPELFRLADIRLSQLDQYSYHDGYEPLFVEYSNMIYYYAEQLLQYKMGGEEDIINCFRQEVNHREIYKRMACYYVEHEHKNKGLSLFVKKKYDEMYCLAYEQMSSRCSSPRYICVRTLLSVIESIM